jgi:acyl carrier protein phosphodiesterase
MILKWYISYILAGLLAEFDSLMTSITTRIDPMSLEELYDHFLTHDLVNFEDKWLFNMVSESIGH